MAEEDHVRRGRTPAEARRAARLELGGIPQLREAGRAARGIGWLTGLALDMRLGTRLLRRYWGLTLTGGLAMAVGIGIPATVFAYFDIFWNETVPLEEGDRVVAVQLWDATASRRREIAIEDFERWSTALDSFADFGGFRTVEHRIEAGDGPDELVPIAEMTPSGFRVARVDPVVGRPLVDDDARPEADPVVVIGYDVGDRGSPTIPASSDGRYELERRYTRSSESCPKASGSP